MFLRRAAEKDILKGAQFFPVVAILGPRQSGKTTLAKELFKNHRYLSLEDLDLRVIASKDPRTFLLTNLNEHGIIIDEFQYVPELFSYIQTIVDNEQKPGYFILTGSQNFLMNQSITQSLAGRISLHTLLPLSIQELVINGIKISEIENIMLQGLYPAIYAKNMDFSLFYRNYIQTYIERDVRQLTQVGDLTTFQTFLTLCASRVGQLINLSSLGNDCGISDTTVKRWISILKDSYIIYTLAPNHNNFGKRLIKSSKLFFYDVGLACFLLQIKTPEALIIHPNRGNLFESLVISDIVKWFYNKGQLPRISFWQDKTGREVDCIIEEGLQTIPIEIKSGRTPNPKFFEGLEYWQSLQENKNKQSYVIYAGSREQVRGYPNLVSWQNIDHILDKID